jgi:hypothetical protein
LLFLFIFERKRGLSLLNFLEWFFLSLKADFVEFLGAKTLLDLQRSIQENQVITIKNERK